MSKIQAMITGVGAFLPEYVLNNEELSKMVDTTDEWIMTRIGIKERRVLKEKGEGLIGIVFGTNDINKSRKKLIDKGFLVGDISSGEGTNFKDRSIRKWKNLFLPPELTRAGRLDAIWYFSSRIS